MCIKGNKNKHGILTKSITRRLDINDDEDVINPYEAIAKKNIDKDALFNSCEYDEENNDTNKYTKIIVILGCIVVICITVVLLKCL